MEREKGETEGISEIRGEFDGNSIRALPEEDLNYVSGGLIRVCFLVDIDK